MLVTSVIETKRICKSCGLEKPIEEFRPISRWRIRVCDECRHKQVVEYHHQHWKEYYKKYQEGLKERTREYYLNHREENIRLYGSPTKPEHSEKNYQRYLRVRSENMENYGTTKTPQVLKRQKAHYANKRKMALELYGGQCECCGEARYDMLTFDHKIGSGYKTGMRGVRLVYDVIREYNEAGYPNEMYRILCWNCNMSNGFYKYCPHQGNGAGREETHGKQSKLEMIAAYGGRCSLCGETLWEFLTIDHINGGGTKHRAAVGTGVMFYSLLKKQGWPKDEYRLLCLNCNCSKKTNKYGGIRS